MSETVLTPEHRKFIIENSETISGRAMAEQLGVSRTSVHRFIRNHIQGNRERPATKQTQANMDYVRANWLYESDPRMADHLGVTAETVRKYRLDMGLKREPVQVKTFATDQTRLTRQQDNRVKDTADRAADYLASYDRTPVFRIDDTGQPNAKGELWRYGTTRLTTEQMMAKAYRKGFDPDAWRRLAA